MAFDRAALLGKVRATLARYRMLEDGDLVVVAVSGGADSVALLHLLNELRAADYPRMRLHVAHLNHQLRGEEADADEAFVRQLAERLRLPFTGERQDVRAMARAEGRNVEEVAREVRYRFLRRVAAEVGARRIATGHTLTDQAETFLMRLLRGAGGEGLSGIHPIVDDLIIRPLLAVRREETHAYCHALGIAYRVDRSNFEAELWRTRVRQEILPRLMALNPRALEAIGRAAERLRVDEAYFDEVVGNLFPELIISRHDDAMRLSVENRSRGLAEWICRQCSGGQVHVGEISSAASWSMETTWGNRRCRVAQTWSRCRRATSRSGWAKMVRTRAATGPWACRGSFCSRLRMKCTRLRYQLTPASTSEMAGRSPPWASEITSWTPCSPWSYPAFVERVTLTDSGLADHLLSNSSGDR